MLTRQRWVLCSQWLLAMLRRRGDPVDGCLLQEIETRSQTRWLQLLVASPLSSHDCIAPSCCTVHRYQASCTSDALRFKHFVCSLLWTRTPPSPPPLPPPPSQCGMRFHPLRSSSEVVSLDPFSSDRKAMAVLLRLRGADGGAAKAGGGGSSSAAKGSYRAHWKGAADRILARCRHVIDGAGSIVPLTEERVSVTECSAVQCSAVQCSAVEWSGVQCSGGRALRTERRRGSPWLSVALPRSAHCALHGKKAGTLEYVSLALQPPGFGFVCALPLPLGPSTWRPCIFIGPRDGPCL